MFSTFNITRTFASYAHIHSQSDDLWVWIRENWLIWEGQALKTDTPAAPKFPGTELCLNAIGDAIGITAPPIRTFITVGPHCQHSHFFRYSRQETVGHDQPSSRVTVTEVKLSGNTFPPIHFHRTQHRCCWIHSCSFPMDYRAVSQSSTVDHITVGILGAYAQPNFS